MGGARVAASATCAPARVTGKKSLVPAPSAADLAPRRTSRGSKAEVTPQLPRYVRPRACGPTTSRQGRPSCVAAIAESCGKSRAVISSDRTDGWRWHIAEGWLLLRLSGTEPLLRIYTEVKDESLVRPVIEAGQRIAGVAR